MLHTFKQRLLRVLRTSREVGATAVEYALMVAAIAAVVGVAAFALGKASSDSLNKTTTCITANGAGCAPAANP